MYSTVGLGPGMDALSKPHVLLVDDDERLLRALKRRLGGAFAVTVARHGSEGLAQGPAAFDAIVTDLDMPLVGGDAFKRALDEAGVQVPVIFLSAAADLPERARRAGAFAYLPKSSSPAELEALLDRAVGLSAATPTPRPGSSSE
jgi:CheY-like chemotaxis protein